MVRGNDGHSARKSRPYPLNQYFASMRIDEFKYTWTAEIENGVVQKGDWGGLSGFIVTESQEDVTVGIRHIPASVPLMAAAGLYLKELVKYPPQFKIGFLSNNPPVYDLLPKAREMLEKNVEKGVGRQNP